MGASAVFPLGYNLRKSDQTPPGAVRAYTPTPAPPWICLGPTPGFRARLFEGTLWEWWRAGNVCHVRAIVRHMAPEKTQTMDFPGMGFGGMGQI